jgi:hypothetical protein
MYALAWLLLIVVLEERGKKVQDYYTKLTYQ